MWNLIILASLSIFSFLTCYALWSAASSKKSNPLAEIVILILSVISGDSLNILLDDKEGNIPRSMQFLLKVISFFALIEGVISSILLLVALNPA